MLNCLASLVVKVSASGAEDPGFESCLRQDFSGSSHTSDLKIGTPVAILPGAWHYRVNAGTGRPGVSKLWLGEVESLICNFYLSVAAPKIVCTDPSLRYTSMLQPTNNFNGRVGIDHKTWEGIIGRNGVGNSNSNGHMLLSVCSAHDLLITNTIFRLPNHNKPSWMHPRLKHWHLMSSSGKRTDRTSERQKRRRMLDWPQAHQLEAQHLYPAEISSAKKEFQGTECHKAGTTLLV